MSSVQNKARPGVSMLESTGVWAVLICSAVYHGRFGMCRLSLFLFGVLVKQMCCMLVGPKQCPSWLQPHSRISSWSGCTVGASFTVGVSIVSYITVP